MADRRRPITVADVHFKPGEYPSKLFAVNERTDNLWRLGVLQSHMDLHGFQAPEGLEKDHHFWNLTLDSYSRTARTVRRRLREDLPGTDDVIRRGLAQRIALESALDQAATLTAFDERRLTDGLTGAWSRAALDAYLTHLIKKERYTSSDNPADARYTGLLFLDLDHFKKQNDTYGHDYGDRLLVETVKAIKTREEFDMVGRYGGEEFAVILPNMPSTEALVKKAEEISEAIKTQVRITVSVGVSIITPADHSPKTVYKRADRSVYVAKRAGRNRIVMQIGESNGSAAFIDFSNPDGDPIIEVIGRLDKKIGEPAEEPNDVPVITKLSDEVPTQR